MLSELNRRYSWLSEECEVSRKRSALQRERSRTQIDLMGERDKWSDARECSATESMETNNKEITLGYMVYQKCKLKAYM